MRKKVALIFLAVLFIPTSSVLAQRATNLDSLINGITTSTLQDTNLVKNLLRVSSNLFRSYPDSARAYSFKAVAIAQRLNFKGGEAAAYRFIGTSYGVQAKMDSSTFYFEQAKELFEELGDERGLASVTASIGVNYAREKQFEPAITSFLQAVDAYEAYGNSTNMGIMLNNVGNLFLEQELNNRSLEYYERARKVLEEVNHERSLALVYSSLSLVHYKLNNELVGKKYTELAIEYGVKTKRFTTLPIAYNNLGDFYRNEGKLDSALANFQQSLRYAEILRDVPKVNTAKYKIASIDIEMRNFAKAREPLQEVLEWANAQSGIREQGLSALSLLIRVERELRNFEAALTYSMELIAKEDSLNAEEIALKISELETIYETEKKEAQIQLLEVQNEVANLRSLVIGVVAVFIILSIIYTFWQFYRRKAEQKRIKIESLKQELKQFGMVISEKNHFIEKFREHLENVRQHVNTLEGRKELTLLSDNIHHNMNLTGDEKVLFQKVEQVNTGFFAGLKKLEHNLTPREERLATLVQIDLTNKDIANILHMEPDSVKGARRRLKRKLQLDSETDLRDYLKRITA